MRRPAPQALAACLHVWCRLCRTICRRRHLRQDARRVAGRCVAGRDRIAIDLDECSELLLRERRRFWLRQFGLERAILGALLLLLQL